MSTTLSQSQGTVLAANPVVHTDGQTTEAHAPKPLPNQWRGSTWLGWIPSLVVFAMLGALGWYGHHNDWKLPSLNYKEIGDPGAKWCDSHGVAEADCVVCDPTLIEAPPTLKFCLEHGVHGCILHHPELAQTKSSIVPTIEDLQRTARALALMPRPENLSVGGLAGTRIQFASLEAMKKAGVEVELVTRAAITESIQASGEVQYDATKTAQVSPPADGIVREVVANVGDWVRKGDVLAIVDSQDVGRLKSTLLSVLLEERLAKDQLTRFEEIAPSGAIPGRKLLEGESELQQATVAVEQAVRGFGNLGIRVVQERLRDSDLDSMKEYIRSIGMERIGMERIGTVDSDNLIALTAPLDGRIVERTTTLGEVVARGNAMFRVADTRTVWLDLRVPAEQAPLARLGALVRYQPDGNNLSHQGKVTWISTDVDRQTRTVRVRAELANDDGLLRNESFGRGEIVLREEPDSIVVPEESLKWDGTSSVVFVRDARFFEAGRPKFFVTRSVRPGVHQDGMVEILAGVLPGEVVVSKGSDVLRAQLLKSKLGAGCTCGN